METTANETVSHHTESATRSDGDGVRNSSDQDEVSDFSDFESDEFDSDIEDRTYNPCELRKKAGVTATCFRGERVRELLTTELEYIHDLQILINVTIGDTAKDKYNVLDMRVILGNVAQVTDVAHRFSQDLDDAVNNQENEIVVGKVFLKFVEELTEVYKVYCSAYNVDVLPLIKKYENEETTSAALKQLAEELRSHKQHLLDLNCVLIKPVQRFLKYPLYLDELVHATPQTHIDHADLQDAKDSFLIAAKEINEHTRTMDLLHKYGGDDHPHQGRLRRVNLHSLARKSFRVTQRITQKLGVPHHGQAHSSELKQLEVKFYNVQKSVQIFVTNVTSLVEAVRCRQMVELRISEQLVDLYPDTTESLMVKATAVESCTNALQMFDNRVQLRVLHPARQISVLCEGPANVIQKTRKTLMDYDLVQVKLQAALEPSKIASVIEESAGIRSNYETLKNQLITELPIFMELAAAVINQCVQSLVSERMYLQGYITKLYLQLVEEEPGLRYMTAEELEEKAKARAEQLMELLPNSFQKKHLVKKKESSTKKTEKPDQVDSSQKTQEQTEEAPRVSSSSEFFRNLPLRSKSRLHRSYKVNSTENSKENQTEIQNKSQEQTEVPRVSSSSEFFKNLKARSHRSYPLNAAQANNQTPKETSQTTRASSPYEYLRSWSPSTKIRQCKSLFSLTDDNQEEKTGKIDLSKKYPSDVLYKVTKEHNIDGDNELCLQVGDIVAVLKKKDPMGGENRWVVDDGKRVGVVRKDNLTLSKDIENSGGHINKLEQTTVRKNSGTAEPGENVWSSSNELHLIGYSEENNKNLVNQSSVNTNQMIGVVEKDSQPLTQQQQYMAVYNFVAADDSQLNVQKGQVVVGLHTAYQDWWYMKDDYGQEGYVPASYLVKHS